MEASLRVDSPVPEKPQDFVEAVGFREPPTVVAVEAHDPVEDAKQVRFRLIIRFHLLGILFSWGADGSRLRGVGKFVRRIRNGRRIDWNGAGGLLHFLVVLVAGPHGEVTPLERFESRASPPPRGVQKARRGPGQAFRGDSGILYVGIDVSKDKLAVYAGDMFEDEIDNTRRAITRMVKTICRGADRPVRFALEETGCYSLPVHLELDRLGQPVYVVNPSRV